MNDNTILNRFLVSGPGRREVLLDRERLDPDSLPPGTALVRNGFTLVYPGTDLALVARSEIDGDRRRLGRLAIGRVVRSRGTGPEEGQWIYWNGPHADYGILGPERVWAPIPGPDPRLLPAGIGAEAQLGLERALGPGGAAPSHAVIVGQGMLGHLAAQWLKARGASVTVVENSPKRLEFSKYSGLRQKIDTHNVDWMERLRRWNPEGAELLVDACGYAQPIVQVLPILRPGGALCLLGGWRPTRLPDELALKTQEIGGRVTGPSPGFGEAPEHATLLRDWLRAIGEGEIVTERLLTNTCPPEEGRMNVKRLAAGVKSICGVVIEWETELEPTG